MPQHTIHATHAPYHTYHAWPTYHANIRTCAHRHTTYRLAYLHTYTHTYMMPPCTQQVYTRAYARTDGADPAAQNPEPCLNKFCLFLRQPPLYAKLCHKPSTTPPPPPSPTMGSAGLRSPGLRIPSHLWTSTEKGAKLSNVLAPALERDGPWSV